MSLYRRISAARAKPTFSQRCTFTGSLELIERTTRDVYSIIPDGRHFLCAVNHCYQTKRDTLSDAVAWAESEARMIMRAKILAGIDY